MKSFLAALGVAVLLALGAAWVLDTYVQEPVQTAFSTSGVRLGATD